MRVFVTTLKSAVVRSIGDFSSSSASSSTGSFLLVVTLLDDSPALAATRASSFSSLTRSNDKTGRNSPVEVSSDPADDSSVPRTPARGDSSNFSIGFAFAGVAVIVPVSVVVVVVVLVAAVAVVEFA